MKKTQITCLALAVAVLSGSCTSSRQAAGGVTGAMIGGRVGELVGIAAGHGPFRGGSAALGGLVGMGVGAIIGVGVTSSTEKNEGLHARTGRDEAQRAAAAVGRDEAGSEALPPEVNPRRLSPIALSELTYMDVTGDGALSRGETIELEGYITNTSDDVIDDVVICLKVNDTKHFLVSPPLTTSLQSGQKIRYTGRVHCRKARRGESVRIQMTATHAGHVNSSGSVVIPIR